MSRAAAALIGASLFVTVPAAGAAHVGRGRWAALDGERIAVSAGAAFMGGHPLGNRSAGFTENRAPSGGRITYFDASTRLGGSPLWSARLAARTLGDLWVETAVSGGGRQLATSISNDFEGAAPLTLRTDIKELLAEGGVRFDLRRLAFRQGRARPFVHASGGYLRQSPSSAASRLERTGRAYAAGAGLLYRLASPASGWTRNFGVRLEAGLALRSGALELAGERRIAPRLLFSFYTAR